MWRCIAVAAIRHWHVALTSPLTLPRVHKALRGFRKVRPSMSRAPWPRELLAAQVELLVQEGKLDAALQLAVGFFTYIRPGVTQRLRVGQLMPP